MHYFQLFTYRCNFTRSYDAINNQNEYVQTHYTNFYKLWFLSSIQSCVDIQGTFIRLFHFWLYSGMLWDRIQTFKHLVLILTQHITANESELIHAIYVVRLWKLYRLYIPIIIENAAKYFIRISSTILKSVLFEIVTVC